MSRPDLVIALFFTLLALTFLTLAIRRPNPAPARRAHLRIGLIFAAVAAFLILIQPRLH